MINIVKLGVVCQGKKSTTYRVMLCVPLKMHNERIVPLRERDVVSELQ
jgi:hypothetical protein